MKSLKVFAITFIISAPVVFLVEVFALNYPVKAALISGLAGGVGAGIGLLVAHNWKQKQMKA
jgi:hypothetical protein